VSETFVVRPRRLLVVTRILAVVVVVVFAVLALLLPRGEAGGQVFGPPDQIAFFGIGLLIAAAAWQFSRARVEADLSGLRIRNYLGEKRIPWQVIAHVRLDDASPWASLDLADDDTVALLAVQANDGAYAVDAVVELRRRLAASRGPDTSAQ
jgi:hypothetical protein